MSTLINGDTLNATITLNKASNTTITLDTDKKYVTKDIELVINAKTASPSFDGGALNNKGATAAFTNATVSNSNTSGITILAKGTAGRDSVLYNGTVNGWVNAADNAQVSAAISPSTWNGTTYYLTGVNLTNGKSFNITVPNGDSTTTYTVEVDSEGNVSGLGSGSAVAFWDEEDENGGIIRHIQGVSLAGDTVTPAALLQGYTAHNALGEPIVGTAGGTISLNLQDKTVTPSSSSQILQADAGYDGLGIVTVNPIPSSYLIPSGSLSITSNGTHNVGSYANAVVSVTPSLQTKTVTPTTSSQNVYADSNYDGLSRVTVNAIPSNYLIPTGTKTITSNGTNIDVASYATVTVNVSSSSPGISLQSKTGIVPTESSQIIVADDGYDGLSSVEIEAISNTYIGSAITQRDSTDLTVSGGTVTVPAGFYAENASKSVATATHPKPSLSLNSTTGVVTASHTQNTGYVTGGTTSDTLSLTTQAAQTITPTTTAQTISSGRYLTGTQTIAGDANLVAANIKSGVSIFGVTGTYAGGSVSLQAKTDITPTEASQTITADAGYDGLSSVQIDAIDSYYIGSDVPRRTEDDVSINSHAEVSIPDGYYDNTSYALPLANLANPTISVNISTGLITATSNISSTGYISSGKTATNTSQLTTVNGTTITPTESEQTAVAANRYTLGAIKVGAISSTYVGSGITTRNSDSLTVSGATVTAPAGYYASAATKTIASGSVTAPASISGTTATVSTGTNTLTLTKTVSVTPSVTTAGYISAGTAGNSSVSLTASVTTKAAATYNVSSSNQTIAASQYLTGAQTIRGVTTSGISAANIKVGATITVGDSADADRITSVTGTFTSDATATAANITSGATAYVNGSKVTGTLVIQTVYTGTSAPSSSVGSDGDIYIQTQ